MIDIGARLRVGFFASTLVALALVASQGRKCPACRRKSHGKSTERSWKIMRLEHHLMISRREG